MRGFNAIVQLFMPKDKVFYSLFEEVADCVARMGELLKEVVSEPDMSSPEEAYEYLTLLKEIILYTGVSDVNMEEGSLRCDANVSVRPRGQKEFGTKTEVKNVNSFRFIREALEYEIDRQIGVVESGGKITQETRLYNPNEGKTYGMRSKEEAHDYRYFPEPDLLPLVVDENWQQEIRKTLPELPEARRERMIAEYGITPQDAQVLTTSKSLADQFEAAAKAAKNPKRVANLVQGELMGRLKAKGLEIEQSPISMKGVAFSADSAQRFLYVASRSPARIWVFDRKTLQPLDSFGRPGIAPGEFDVLHHITTDSKGNLYASESEDGRRVQKFVFKGIISVPAK